MRFGLTTFLGSLSALAMLAACETPDVAGNTVDTLNTLEAVYPDSANVNVSYRYAYQGPTQLRVDAVGEGQAHVYAGAGTEPPDRFVQVFISTPVEGYEPVATERLRFGDREFLSVIYCIQSPVEAEATGMAPFLRALSDLEITPPEIAYVRHFIPVRTESDGRRVHVLFMRDLAASGSGCADLSDPGKAVGPDPRPLAEILRDESLRSFEIMA